MSDFDPKDYWEDRLSSRFGLHGVGHYSLGKCFNRWAYRVRGSVFKKIVKSSGVALEYARVLDVGSGTGFYLEMWRSLGASKIHGSDITVVAVDKLGKKYPDCSMHLMDISRDISDLSDQRFDIITAMDVLFHIVDDEKYAQAFRNVYALLKPGGLFIFSDFLLHGREFRIEHLAARSFDSVNRILTDAGFQVIKRKPFLYLLNDPLDTESESLMRFWRSMVTFCKRGEAFGNFLGTLLYPLELFLVSTKDESPTTEILICRKPDD